MVRRFPKMIRLFWPAFVTRYGDLLLAKISSWRGTIRVLFEPSWRDGAVATSNSRTAGGRLLRASWPAISGILYSAPWFYGSFERGADARRRPRMSRLKQSELLPRPDLISSG